MEKILAKYPNCFDILYNSALLYNMGGLETKNQSLLQRALEQLKRHNPCGINASLIGNTLASICP